MIGEDIIGMFASLGDLGMLLAITVIIWIDGTAFPTLPEVWMVWIFGVHPSSFAWAVALIVVASLASLLGNFTLYGLVKIAKLPPWIQKKMRQYTNFLVVHDERLLLLNRIAPIVPYTGAFIATCNWNLKKCAVYIFASALAKFSIIVLISWASFDQLKDDVAPWVSLIFVAAFILVSLIVSFVYKRRQTSKGEPERSQS
jgi:membrane protein DedA with SNARE-associated domain